MYKDKRVLAIIPARGGSEGVPRKNIRLLAGKPLLAWTVEAAGESRYIDRCVLSSDDMEIIAVAREFGCDVPFVRPAELASHDTPGIAPVFHAVNALDEHYDVVVLLQPTSPLRSAEDIDGAIECCLNSGYGTSVSVTVSAKHPEWMFSISEQGSLLPFREKEMALSRQQLNPVYVLNGAVYAITTSLMSEEKRLVIPGKSAAYVMPAERSIDIDTIMDFCFAETLISERSRHVQ
jgi:CMP-N,N'-diacetyllegionaminic acid synthase